MSAERMITIAMQEQPLFLIPVLVFILLINARAGPCGSNVFRKRVDG